MEQSTKSILLIDINETHYAHIRRLLHESQRIKFHFTWTSSATDGIAQLLCGGYDACFVEYQLGNQTGLDVITQVRRAGSTIPLILLADSDEQQIDLQALELGATDYIEWHTLSTALLERTIVYAVEHAHTLEALHTSQEQFRQAQKMEAVGRLAGGVAHDFNNLLTTITGYCELILADNFSDTSFSHTGVEEILKASRRAAALTQQLLAFSRRQVMQPDITNLNMVIKDIEPMIDRLVGETIQIQTILDPTLGPVLVDHNQIAQVLLNLIVNARDAMPKGGTITIETKNSVGCQTLPCESQCTKKGGCIEMIVRDTGEGMNADVMSHLFEPFFTTKERGRGTGLGLSTVYGIVKQSKGNIQVESRVGKGSTFHIFLPRIKALDQQRTITQSIVPMHGSETILLVEDEEAVRDLIASVLRRAGYRVIVTNNGHQALQIATATSDTIDLLISDVVMPEINGPDLARRLNQQRPKIHVLFISGYTDEELTLNGLRNTNTSFLQKPFSLDKLLKQVRETLDTPLIMLPHERSMSKMVGYGLSMSN